MGKYFTSLLFSQKNKKSTGTEIIGKVTKYATNSD